MRKSTVFSNWSFIIIKVYLVLCCTTTYSQVVKNYDIKFKGFRLILSDIATDEHNNHLLVGSIASRTQEAKDRDPRINKAFGLDGVVYGRDKMGIMITTDADYNILNIAKSHRGEQVVYDENRKKFIVAAGCFEERDSNERLNSIWRPVIVITDIQLNATNYFVKKKYSSILKKVVVEKDHLLLFSRSDKTEEKYPDRKENAEIWKVSTQSIYKDTIKLNDGTNLEVRNTFKPIFSLETPYNDKGSIKISDIYNIDGSYYFTTSNFNQENSALNNHFYQLTGDKLKRYTEFYELIDEKSSDWESSKKMINTFLVDKAKNFVFLKHKKIAKKEMTLVKTKDFKAITLSKKLPLFDYVEYDAMRVLNNGNFLILKVNERGTWSYCVYNSVMKLVKEVDSGVYDNYKLSHIREVQPGNVVVFFYRNVSYIQTLNLN